MKMSNEEDSNEKRISKPIHTLNLDRVVFIGRTFSEYMRMFNLEPSQLKGLKILDCPSGALINIVILTFPIFSEFITSH